MELIRSLLSLFYNLRGVWRAAAKAAFLVKLIGTLVTVAVVVLVVYITWCLFQKAGKEGWASLVPLYRDYVLYDIAFGNGLLFLIKFIPVARLVFRVMMSVRMAKAFGKGTGFGVGLFLLPLVFRAILVIDDSAVYRGPIRL